MNNNIDNDIRARERRAREYLTKKEMARRRWKKEARREVWGEILGGLLVWIIILILIWL